MNKYLFLFALACGTVGIIVGLIGVVTNVLGLPLDAVDSQPYINTNVNEIQGISQFVVLEQGSQYVARFSLMDNDMAPAASDATVLFKVPNKGYRDTFRVSANDFGEYQLQLTGQKFIAYAWIPENLCCGSKMGTAYISVELPDGRVFNAHTTVF